MTIQTGYVPISYAGDNITNSFPITFDYQLSSQIVANYFVVATSITTPLVYGTDFSVTPISNSPAATGTLTLLLAPLPSGTDLLITRVTDVTQDTSWVPNATNPSTAFENAVDKLTMIDQEAQFGAITDAALGSGTADASTFLRGDRAWANTLVGPLGPLTAPPPTDVQTLFEVQQSGASAIKVASGIGAQGSFRYAVDGDTNAWAAQWVYDPNIAALGFQAYGGSIKGTFDPVTGDVFFAGDLNVSGTTNSTLFTGAADASLITTGTIDTARLGSGSANINTFLRGDQTWGVVTGGGGGINTTTTAPFTIAAVNSTQSVSVADATGIVAGTDLQISDGTHLIIGLVTVVASLTLTIQTQAIPLGIAGNTMASGAAVQSSTVPGTNTIQLGDGSHSPTAISALQLFGDVGSRPAGATTVDTFIQAIGGGSAVVRGYVNSNFSIDLITAATTAKDAIVKKAAAGTSWLPLQPSAQGDVLHATSSSVLGFSKLTAPDSITAATITPALLNITNSLTDKYLFAYDSGSGHFKQTLIDSTNVTPASLTPALLNVTNALTDTQLFGYDSASGHFKMFAQSSITPGSILPSQLNVTNSLTDTYLFGYDSGTGHFKMFAQPSFSGTTSQFINGAGTATNTLIAPGGSPAQLIFSDASTNQMILSGSGGFPGSISSKVGGVDNHQQPFDFLQPLNIGIAGTALIDTAGAIGSWATEGIIAQGWTRATGGNRSTAGYWEQIAFVANPGTTYTADVNTSAYFRFTALANNVVVTIKDTTPLPSNSSYRFAGELIIELVAPTGFDMTFAAFGGETITWAAGASAPTRANGQISNAGTNVFRFTRRQGITGWIGSVDNTVGTITGTGTVTSITAGSGLSGGTITTSGTIAIGAGSVTASMIANNTITAAQISPTANFPTSVLSLPGGTANFLREDGAWAPAGGGGGQAPITMRLGGSSSGMPASGVVSSIGLTASTGMTITKSVVGSGVTYTLSSSATAGTLPFYYVAAPSGSASTDTTNIQNAINSAGAAGGGIVVLQAGTYFLNGTITLDDDNVNILGAGSARVDGGGGLPTTGTNILWTGATLTGCMMLAGTPGQPVGCRYEGFSLFGGTVVGTQKAVGMRFGGGAHNSLRDLGFCNFTDVGLDLYSASGDPTDAIKGPNHFTLDNIWIDVGTLYWQAYNAMPLSPSTAIGLRIETFDYGDLFGSSLNNIFIVHNYTGLWLGNSDNNVIVDLQTYGYPNSVGPVDGTPSGGSLNPSRGLFVTSNSTQNRVIGCTAYVVAKNSNPALRAQCMIYDLDVVNPGDIGNALYVGTHCEIMFTVGTSAASGGSRAGTYYAGPSVGFDGTTGLYSIVFNDSLGKVSITNRAGTVTSF